MKRWLTLVLVVGLSAPLLRAQEPKPVPKEDPAHQELRALKEHILEAFNKKDIDTMLKYVHPNVVVTWQDARVSRGHDGIRNYYKEMLEGPNRRVQSVTARANVDELTILYGDSNGLAFGTLDQDFTLTDGRVFPLNSRWTAHVVKDDNGQWVVSGLHASANIFDNGVLHLALRKTALWTGIGAGVGGLVVGAIVCSLLRRRPATGTTP
jgi:uncharacterized protein (TIGR02246 family)